MKKTTGEKAFNCINHIFLIFLCVITLYPFLFIVFASLSDPGLLIAHRGLLLAPAGFSTDAYRAVLQNRDVYVGYCNTILYVVAGTAVNILMTSIGAYVLSRRFLFRNFIMVLIMITMFFGGGLIPGYLWMRQIGFMNNPMVMIIPGAISTSNLIIMMTSFRAIPMSLEEAAKIDGANEIYILFHIILPLSLPVIAVMVLYYGVAHWNEWFNAMIYLQDRDRWPLQLYLREILIQNASEGMLGDVNGDTSVQISETIKYATMIVATVPIVCVYPFIQKYFTKGVMIGSLKG